MDHPLTHLDTAGHARMVDVTDKQPTIRSATAAGRVVTSCLLYTSDAADDQSTV